MSVLNIDAIESLTNGAGRLISSEDTLTRSANSLGSLDEFSLELITTSSLLYV